MQRYHLLHEDYQRRLPRRREHGRDTAAGAGRNAETGECIALCALSAGVVGGRLCLQCPGVAQPSQHCHDADEVWIQYQR